MTTAHIRPASPRWAAALAGALAGAVAIAASELVAGLLGAPSLVVAIGALVISLQPPGAKEVMVAAFGTNDKLALNLIVVAAAVAIAAGAGILAARRFQSGAAVFVGFGVVAAAAAVAQPLNSAPPAVLNAAIAVGAALATFAPFWACWSRPARWPLACAPATRPPSTAPSPVVSSPPPPRVTPHPPPPRPPASRSPPPPCPDRWIGRDAAS